MKAQNLLIGMLKKELKFLGYKVKNFTDKDWETIAYEWVKESRIFIEETIGNDMTGNPKLFTLARRRKALVDENC